ncbi:MAG: helix-turn-helix domain-containing protein [Rhodothermia bacterium]
MREHTVSSGNVFADMGFEPDEAVNLKIRAGLMMKIAKHIKDNGLTQANAAELFGVSQPRVSNLVSGKIDLFSIDMLITMATAAGMKVSVDVYA